MTQLKSMWLSGQTTAATLYWREDIQEWSSLGNLVEEAIAADRPTQAPVATKPEDKGWSTVEYVILVICTVVIPILGLIVGFMGLFNPAKRQRAVALLGLAMLVIALAWIYLNR